MSKIIIENNHETISDLIALECVMHVVSGGKISGSGDKAQYCYHSTFTIKPDGTKVQVAATKNKASDRFVVFQ